MSNELEIKKIQKELDYLKKLTIINDVPWETANIDIIESLNEFLKKGNNNFKFTIYQKLMKMISENRDMSQSPPPITFPARPVANFTFPLALEKNDCWYAWKMTSAAPLEPL